MSSPSAGKSRLRQVLAVVLLGLSVIVLIRLTPMLQSKDIVKVDDFVEYWAAGRLNLSGGNPFSPEQLLPLQLGTGRTHDVPVMMWNPPWTLPLVMPFGALSYPWGRLLWFITHTALVLFCASYCWRLYGGPSAYRWLAWLLALTFPPTLFVLKTGQIPTAVLLGGVLFLRWTERRHWWLASLAFLLMAVKPHTLYLVPFAFLLWAVQQRRWALLAAGGLGLVLATGLALWFNPLVLKQYFYAVSHHPPKDWATPTLGGTLRYLFGVEKVWLQFVPPVLGAAWLGLHWWKRRLAWSWPRELPCLMCVSVLTAAYGWSCDSVVLIPVILAAAAGVVQQGANRRTLLVAGLYLALVVGILAFYGRYHDFWYLWLTPALVGWCFLTVRLEVLRLRP